MGFGYCLIKDGRIRLMIYRWIYGLKNDRIRVVFFPEEVEK